MRRESSASWRRGGRTGRRHRSPGGPVERVRHRRDRTWSRGTRVDRRGDGRALERRRQRHDRAERRQRRVARVVVVREELRDHHPALRVRDEIDLPTRVLALQRAQLGAEGVDRAVARRRSCRSRVVRAAVRRVGERADLAVAVAEPVRVDGQRGAGRGVGAAVDPGDGRARGDRIRRRSTVASCRDSQSRRDRAHASSRSPTATPSATIGAAIEPRHSQRAVTAERLDRRRAGPISTPRDRGQVVQRVAERVERPRPLRLGREAGHAAREVQRLGERPALERGRVEAGLRRVRRPGRAGSAG